MGLCAGEITGIKSLDFIILFFFLLNVAFPEGNISFGELVKLKRLPRPEFYIVPVKRLLRFGRRKIFNLAVPQFHPIATFYNF